MHIARQFSSSCPATTTDCLGLPNSSAVAVRPDRASYVSAFRSRPWDYLPSWGGKTGLASRLVSIAKRHASFAAVVDIGCNTGDWSRSWLGREGHGGGERIVLCIEAVPSLATAVKLRLSKLPGGERVHVVNVALSNVSGEERPLFGLPSGARGARAQTGAGLSLQKSEGAHVSLGSVQVQTLDHVLRQWRLLGDGELFVKVDVEGFDVHVLAGAACALQRGAIDVLQIEWNRRKLHTAAPRCVSLRRVALLLEKFGYAAYLVGRPYVPLNFGHWHDAYEAAQLPCPPYCTGDVVALRRGWAGYDAVARQLTARAPPASGATRPRARPRPSPMIRG